MTDTGELATSGPDYSAGIMVCVTPSPDECAALALEGGCPPDDMHCTLGYFGTTDEADDRLRDDLVQVCSMVATDHDPMAGEISGAMIFTANPQRPLIASPDVVGLGELRADLVTTLADQGVTRTDHGFTPHVTLAYDAGADDLAAASDQVTGLPVSFAELTLVYGDESMSWPLAAGTDTVPAEVDGQPAEYRAWTGRLHGASRGGPAPASNHRRLQPFVRLGGSWRALPADPAHLAAMPAVRDAVTDRNSQAVAEALAAQADPSEVMAEWDGLDPEQLDNHDDRKAAALVLVAGLSLSLGEMASAVATARSDGMVAGWVGGATTFAAAGVAVPDAPWADDLTQEDIIDGEYDIAATAALAAALARGEALTDDAQAQADKIGATTLQRIANALAEGVTLDELADAIASEGRAATIAEFESGLGIVAGMASFGDAAGAELYAWVTVDDPCDECDDLGAEEAKAFDEWDVCPLHPNCRCELVPIPPDGSEMTMRATKTISDKAGRRFVNVRPGSGTLSTTVDQLAVGDVVTIDGTELTGIVSEFVTDGTVSGDDGSGLPATPENPVVLVAICDQAEDGSMQPTDQMVGCYAEDLTPAGDPATDVGPEEEPAPPSGLVLTPEQAQLVARGWTAVAGPDDPTKLVGLTPPGGRLADTPAPDAGAPDEATLPPFRQSRREAMPSIDPRIGPANAARAKAGDWDYQGIIVEEAQETGDGRLILQNALTWRDLPITVMAMFQNPETGGHALALTSASCWQIERVGDQIVASGFFDSGAAGQELRRMMAEGTMTRCSVDLDMMRSEVWWNEETGEPLFVVSQARIMGFTACNFPAMQEAVLYLADVAAEDVPALVASGQIVWEMDGRYWAPIERQLANLPTVTDVEPGMLDSFALTSEDGERIGFRIPTDGELSTLAVSGSAELPIAPADTPWAADDAAARVLELATVDGVFDSTVYAAAFLWHADEMDDDDPAAYQLGYADVVDGHLAIVPAALHELADGIIDAGIPDGEYEAVSDRLAHLTEQTTGELANA